MTRSLIVLPDDSAKPILAAIEGASQTLRVKISSSRTRRCARQSSRRSGAVSRFA